MFIKVNRDTVFFVGFSHYSSIKIVVYRTVDLYLSIQQRSVGPLCHGCHIHKMRCDVNSPLNHHLSPTYQVTTNGYVILLNCILLDFQNHYSDCPLNIFVFIVDCTATVFRDSKNSCIVIDLQAWSSGRRLAPLILFRFEVNLDKLSEMKCSFRISNKYQIEITTDYKFMICTK